jgi:hypothetical protein
VTLQERIRSWVESQNPGTKALEALQRLEQDAATDSDAHEFLVDLFMRFESEFVTIVLNSGLVEQQRYFAKVRRVAAQRGQKA